jgi:hypothetical protein
MIFLDFFLRSSGNGFSDFLLTELGDFKIDDARVLGNYEPAKGGIGYYLIDKILTESM